MFEKWLGKWNTIQSVMVVAQVGNFFRMSNEDAVLVIQENSKSHQRRAIVKTVNVSTKIDYDVAVAIMAQVGIKVQ